MGSKEILFEASTKRYSAEPERDNFFEMGKGKIYFSEFNGYWKKEFDQPALKNINYKFSAGKVYGITGKVGSGKSGLIGAILKEIPYYSGKLEV